jgi:hypothetical protein
MGRNIKTQDVANANFLEIDLAPLLSSGIYLLSLEGTDMSTTLQFFFNEK